MEPFVSLGEVLRVLVTVVNVVQDFWKGRQCSVKTTGKNCIFVRQRQERCMQFVCFFFLWEWNKQNWCTLTNLKAHSASTGLSGKNNHMFYSQIWLMFVPDTMLPSWGRRERETNGQRGRNRRRKRETERGIEKEGKKDRKRRGHLWSNACESRAIVRHNKASERTSLFNIQEPSLSFSTLGRPLR